MTRERGYLVAALAVIIAAVVVFVCILTFTPGDSPEIDTKTADAPYPADNARNPDGGEIDTPEDGAKPEGGSEGIEETGESPSEDATSPPDSGGSREGTNGNAADYAEILVTIAEPLDEGWAEIEHAPPPTLLLYDDTGTCTGKYPVEWKTGHEWCMYSAQVPPGRYAVATRVEHFKPYTSEVFVLASGETRDLTILLEIDPRAEIAGTVTDSKTGLPLEGVEIRCVFTVNDYDYRCATALTDVTGRYILEVPAPVKLFIDYEKDGRRDKDVTTVILEGERKTVDVALRPISYIYITLKGSVVDAGTGIPLFDAHIRLKPGTCNIAYSTIDVTDSEGRFESELKLGSEHLERDHQIFISHAGYIKWFGERFTLEDGGDYTFNIRLEPRPAASVEGVVVDSTTGAPIAGAKVRIEGWKVEYGDDCLTDSLGRFRFEGIPDYSFVFARHEGYAPWRSKMIRAREGGSSTIEIGLTPRSATVRVKVLDAQTGLPVTEARVSVTGSEGGDTGMDGIVELNVTPKRHTGEAEHPGYVTAKTEPFEIAAGETHKLAIMLHPLAGEVFGNVFDSMTGGPLVGEWLNVEFVPEQDLGDVSDQFSIVLDESEGTEYSMRLPAGRFAVYFEAAEYVYAERSVLVTDGTKLKLDIGLEPIPDFTATIAGEIADATSSRIGLGTYIVFYYKDTTVYSFHAGAKRSFKVRVPPGEIVIGYGTVREIFDEEIFFIIYGTANSGNSKSDSGLRRRSSPNLKTVVVHAPPGAIRNVVIELEPEED